jgi:hypothetical protein
MLEAPLFMKNVASIEAYQSAGIRFSAETVQIASAMPEVPSDLDASIL